MIHFMNTLRSIICIFSKKKKATVRAPQVITFVHRCFFSFRLSHFPFLYLVSLSLALSFWRSLAHSLHVCVRAQVDVEQGRVTTAEGELRKLSGELCRALARANAAEEDVSS
jgi:hypothetical protein